MIDTVCLQIPSDKVSLLAGASPWNPLQYQRLVKNPSKENLDSGLYFPRLTAYKPKAFIPENKIRIEFSVPKLLLLNNLDELAPADFPAVIETLHDRLGAMGVAIPQEALQSASVGSVHFSKNIQLADGYTASHLISEMGKVDLRKSFDIARCRYVNDGESLYAHTAAHELIIYDKIADLGKQKKRAVDKEQTPYQLGLYAELKNKQRMIEVIRFEVRLNQRQKMNEVLEQLGYPQNPTFKDVFSAEVSKKVVTDYWERLIKARSAGVFLGSVSLKDILRTLFLARSKLKPKQAIYLTGLFTLANDENGIRELRSILASKAHQRTWYRISKDIRSAVELITKNKVRDWVAQIDNGLANYKPLNIKSI